MSFLAGDLGGTKTLLGLYDDAGAPLHQRRYGSHDHRDLEEIVALFLQEREVAAAPQPRVAAFGVAGPVTELTSFEGERQQARITNLSWELDSERLRAAAGLARVRLVNDFHAVAAATAFLAGPDTEDDSGVEGLAGGAALRKSSLVALNPGARPNPRGALAVLGAGTGLGEAIIARTGSEAVILPSEGGHTDLAPRDEVEIELLRFLQRRHGRHISYERVLCGAGLLALYEFFREYRGADLESPSLRIEIDRDRAFAPALVSRHGLDGTDALCIEALDRFVSIYGAEAGNLALKALATGGVFIGGGIAPKILHKLEDGTFLEGFLQKGRFAGLLSAVPVHVITNPEAGLLGAAVIARALTRLPLHSHH